MRIEERCHYSKKETESENNISGNNNVSHKADEISGQMLEEKKKKWRVKYGWRNELRNKWKDVWEHIFEPQRTTIWIDTDCRLFEVDLWLNSPGCWSDLCSL